ncbi:MAG: hypothetical protein ACRCSF_07940 [Mycobacteriaceae bacterium]
MTPHQKLANTVVDYLERRLNMHDDGPESPLRSRRLERTSHRETEYAQLERDWELATKHSKNPAREPSEKEITALNELAKRHGIK